MVYSFMLRKIKYIFTNTPPHWLNIVKHKYPTKKTRNRYIPVPRTVKRSRRLLVAAFFCILFKELVLNVAGDKFV